MNYLIIGPPGCGKGTQSNIIKNYYNIPHLSTGNLLRDEIKSESELGNKVKEIIDNGDFVDDNTMCRLVEKNLKNYKNGFLLDGFPRTIEQAKKLATRIDRVIFIDLPYQICVERILGRCEGRDDDNEEVALHRLKQYEEKTYPVIQYYEKMGKVIKIDASIGIKEKITEMILEQLK